MKKPILISLALLGLLSFSSCEEFYEHFPNGGGSGNGNDPSAGCRIVRTEQVFNPTLSRVYVCTYDDQGRFLQVQHTFNGKTRTKNYSYNEDSVFMNSTNDAGIIDYRAVVKNNAQGFVEYRRIETMDGANIDWWEQQFTYRGRRVQSHSETSNTNATTNPLVYTYNWQNGNVVSITNPDGVDYYNRTYYLNHRNQYAFYYWLNTNLYLGKTIYNRNLEHEWFVPEPQPNDIRYTYTFDPDGKIATRSRYQAYHNNGDVIENSITYFTYDCSF